MTVTINGSTGIDKVQDGSIQAADLASGVPSRSQLPAGTVLQVVDSGPMTTLVNNTSTTFTDGACWATITPTNTSSKILVCVVQEIQIWNDSAYSTGRWKIQRNINGGAFSDIYIDYSTENGNVFQYDYGGSGINTYRPTSYTMLDTPNTTSACIYKTQIAKGTNGGNRITVNSNSPGRMILMEIAA